MGAFNFKNKLVLNIEGNKFTIDTSNEDLVKAQQKLVNDSLALAQKSKDAQEKTLDNYPEHIKELISISSEYIKAVIGEEGFNKVFKDKVIDYNDLSDLVMYICDEITAFKQKRLTEYAQRMS